MNDRKKRLAPGASSSSGTPSSSGPAAFRAPPRKADAPRRVRAGVRLRSREGVIRHTPLSERWTRMFEDAMSLQVLDEGLRYARLGQTIALEISAGRIDAQVQGRAPKPYQLTIQISAFSEEQWQGIVGRMAEEAVYLVKLLAGDLPDAIHRLLASMNLALLPHEFAVMHPACSCAEEKPCKHLAAVGYLFAEQLATKPLVLLTLLGMPSETLIDRLRQQRMIQARGSAAAHVDPWIERLRSPAPPLESCLDDFWRSPSVPRQEIPPSNHLPHALLRRLGPSPLKGRFPLAGLLASVYDTVSRHAIRIRDRAERIMDVEKLDQDDSA